MKIIAVVQIDASDDPQCFLPNDSSGNGSSSLKTLTDSLSEIERLDGVIVAMPDNASNRQRTDYLRSKGIECFFGDVDNVASRLYSLGLEKGADAILRIPGTHGSIDSNVIDKIIEKFLDENADICFDEVTSSESFYDLVKLEVLSRFLDFKKGMELVPGIFTRYYTWVFAHPHWFKTVSVSPKGTEELCAAKNRLPWYHVTDLGNGIVTKGICDQRDWIEKRGIPKNLNNERVADVGSYDGFFAFESERRGAKEVYSFDIPDGTPHDQGQGIAHELMNEKRKLLNEISLPEGFEKNPFSKNDAFELARKTYKSEVVREYCNIYDLSKEKYGQFDRVYCFALLLHLLKPMLALERLSDICRGELHINTWIDYKHGDEPVMSFHEVYHERGHKDLVTWWTPTVECLKQMLRTYGFKKIEILGLHGQGEEKDQVNLVASK